MSICYDVIESGSEFTCPGPDPEGPGCGGKMCYPCVKNAITNSRTGQSQCPLCRGNIDNLGLIPGIELLPGLIQDRKKLEEELTLLSRPENDDRIDIILREISNIEQIIYKIQSQL